MPVSRRLTGLLIAIAGLAGLALLPAAASARAKDQSTVAVSSHTDKPSPIARTSSSSPFTYTDFWFRAQQLAQAWCLENFQNGKGVRGVLRIAMRRCNAGDAGNWKIANAMEVDENYNYRFKLLRAGAFKVEGYGTPNCKVVTHWEEWKWTWLKASFANVNGHMEWRIVERYERAMGLPLPAPGPPPWVGYAQLPFSNIVPAR